MRLRQLVRPVVRRTKPGLRNLVMCALAGLAVGVWTGDVRAQSGDFPVTPEAGLVPSYLISEESCKAIRTAIGDEATSPFDLLLACSIEGRQSGALKSPCDLIDQTNSSNNVGVPLGQCLDSFPFPLITPEPGQALLEGGVNLKSSARGQNLALSDGDRISVTAVTAVQAAAGKVLGVIKVEPSPTGCSGGDCPAICGGIKVVQSGPSPLGACDKITDLLKQSVLTDPPELSHALFLDVQKAATADFMSVAVCPKYKWTCSDPATPPVATGVDYEGLLSFGIVQGSVCFCTSRLCVYCCAQRTTGAIITPCPR